MDLNSIIEWKEDLPLNPPCDSYLPPLGWMLGCLFLLGLSFPICKTKTLP